MRGHLALECGPFTLLGERSGLEHEVHKAFEAWREPVYRFLLTVAGTANDAEDLTQETFIRLFEHLRAGRSIENSRAWLFRVAHNLAIDLSRRPYRTLEASSGDEEGAEPADPHSDIEQCVLDRERRDRVLGRLSPQERRCMELRTEGLRYREIADVLGLRIPTVQTMLARAVRKLSGNGHV